MSYCVYKHTFPNEKVYIGITHLKPERRWRQGKAYKHNKYLTNAVLKYGWDNIKHDILYDGLSKEEAEEKEKELILLYNSINRKYGYNLDFGGNSVGKHTKVTRLKISQNQKKLNRKKIIQCDLNNNFLKEYDGLRIAERETSIPHQNISMCCKKNKYTQAGGYIWYYKEDYKK